MFIRFENGHNIYCYRGLLLVYVNGGELGPSIRGLWYHSYSFKHLTYKGFRKSVKQKCLILIKKLEFETA